MARVTNLIRQILVSGRGKRRRELSIGMGTVMWIELRPFIPPLVSADTGIQFASCSNPPR